MVAELLPDIRYALRQLRKAPGFTITAVLTLALGIGANAAIFTLIHAVLLRNLPVTDPNQLIRIGDNDDCCVSFGPVGNGDYTMFSTDTYRQLKKNAPEFEELAAMQAGFTFRPIVMRRDKSQEPSRSVMGEFVSGNYFAVFGLRPKAGRLIAAGDDIAGAPFVAVMSHETWRRDYGGDATVVGSTFWVNTKAVTIAGIAPEGYFGDRLTSTPPDFYLPIATMEPLTTAPYVEEPRGRWLYIVGRIKPGTDVLPLQAKLSTLVKQTVSANADYTSERGKALLNKVHVVLTPGGRGIQAMQEEYASNLHLLMWISAVVLLIACANIANLLLVRGVGRKAEMSVRTALGAARGRLVQQLLTESLVLAGLSGIVALLVAYLGTRMLLVLAFGSQSHVPIHAGPSLAVLGFACCLTFVTGVLFGVAPAWITAESRPAQSLRSGTRSTAASLLQRGLVVVQAALSLVLLVGAGLFAQSLNRLQNTDLKLTTRNRYIVHMNPQAAGYAQTQVEVLYQTMQARFHAIPGVQNVGISSYTPMEDNNNGWSVQIAGKPNKNAGASFIKANAEYFDSVGTQVLMGRGIRPEDNSKSATVAVVNQSFVNKFFEPGENPIGRQFGSPGPDSVHDYEIVGVVADTAYTSARWKNHAMYFTQLAQRPPSAKGPIEKDEMMYAGAIVLQTNAPIADLESVARKTLSAINPNLAVVRFQTFDAQVADRFTDERMIARLTMLFGVLALILAAVGLYGVTAYAVARRTQEIGIRMALGARRSGVVAMVLRGALIQTAVGLMIGIPVALMCVRFVKAQLYEVAGADAGVLAAATFTLVLAACLAGIIPARRAATVDPQSALRHE
jgi:predicted permease